MNWKTYVEKKNAETYVLPKHWDSREHIAEQLECSTDKVDDHLRPGLRSGEIQKQTFVIWDENLKRKVSTVAYCETKLLTPAAEKETPGAKPDVAEMKAMKAAGKTYAEIGAKVGMTGDKVRGLLRRNA